MTTYHSYHLDKFGEIIAPGRYLTFQSDRLAMAAAAELADYHAGIEVWDGARMVGRVARAKLLRTHDDRPLGVIAAYRA